MFYRWDLINFVASKIEAKNYLEIGVHFGECFERVKIKRKIGVDPSPLGKWADDGRIIKTTSDDFFANNRLHFDVVFVDGLHTREQAAADIRNAVKFLTPGGWVVVHDCSPQREEYQRQEAVPGALVWNGDVWKAIIDLRHDESLMVWTVNIDNGCAVIQRRQAHEQKQQPPPPCDDPAGLTFDWLKQWRVAALNLISPQTFQVMMYD